MDSIEETDQTGCFIGKYDIIALEKEHGPCVYLIWYETVINRRKAAAEDTHNG